MKSNRIFIPQNYGFDYCKSPQALVFDDFVRIYFSYCVPDGEKLKSRVGFADYDKSFSFVIRTSKKVILDGKLGTFDEHGIFPFSPFRDGRSIKAIISGWTRRVSVSTDSGIGLAISEDGGETFVRIGDGPIMTANIAEPYLVIDGFVIKNEDKYFMYYIFGTEWADYGTGQPERTYRIGMAESETLLDWRRDGKQIIKNKYGDEAQALPSVIFYKGMWHMFFCYRHTVGFRENSDRAYRIGYACSSDLVNWTRDDGKVKIPEEDWSSEMQCYPNAFIMDGEGYLMYNGNHFGKEGFGIVKLEDVLG